MIIHELKYSTTNTYLIEGEQGILLFDTGWAGTFPAFCAAMGAIGIPVQRIQYILISHFHPDHMGIAQEIAEMGPSIAIMDVQADYIHAADHIFAKEKKNRFLPIDDARLRKVALEDSRAFLAELGIEGEILHTPGHSEDSISLCLDDGTIFVGDLNPLYELELHRGTEIADSWDKLQARQPRKIYYGHAKAARLDEDDRENPEQGDVTHQKNQSGESCAARDLSTLVSKIMKYIDKGLPAEKIRKKTGADISFIEDVSRMYLTHQNVGVQGILDRIEIKNR